VAPGRCSSPRQPRGDPKSYVNMDPAKREDLAAAVLAFELVNDVYFAATVLAFELVNNAYFAVSVCDQGDECFGQFTGRQSALPAKRKAGIGACYVLVATDGSALGRFSLYDVGTAGRAARTRSPAPQGGTGHLVTARSDARSRRSRRRARKPRPRQPLAKRNQRPHTEYIDINSEIVSRRRLNSHVGPSTVSGAARTS
jgi:hypothetical protein